MDGTMQLPHVRAGCFAGPPPTQLTESPCTVARGTSSPSAQPAFSSGSALTFEFPATSKTLLPFPASLGCSSLVDGARPCLSLAGMVTRTATLRHYPALRTKETGGVQRRGRGSSQRHSSWPTSRVTAVETELRSSHRGVSLALRLPF